MSLQLASSNKVSPLETSKEEAPIKQQHQRRMTRCSSTIKQFFANMEFKYIKLAQLLCGVYILIVTFTYQGALGVFGGARDSSSGYIIDVDSPENTAKGLIEFTSRNGDTYTRAIVAETNLQMVLLGLSRFSGFFMYPAIVLVFWTKFRAIQTFIHRTPFCVFAISDTHRLHVYCGWIILIDACFHTIFHLSRWASQGNLYLVFGSRSGRTGFAVILSTFLIVLPMTPILKNYFRFEMRKYAHYLFWVFVIAMCFHAPYQALPNAEFCSFIFPILMVTYLLDAFYVKAFMTERIGTVKYETTKSGVQLTMPVTDQFASRVHAGGYGYIMFDWINKHQWHAFSIYEDPLDKKNRHMFVAKTGDWTDEVHRRLHDRNTVRPVWISGPFPSPYNNAIQYDNMILVACGIGITPALSAIEAYKDSRRVNLIWATRDAAMLVFFLKNAKLDHKGCNLVFYTGKDPLPETIENFNVNANLQIIKERPKLANILPNVIQYIDKHGHSQHEDGLVDKDQLAISLLKQESQRSKLKTQVSFAQQVASLSSFANNLGYDMPELMDRSASQIGPSNLATIPSQANLSDADLDEAEAQAMLRKLNAMAENVGQSPDEIAHSCNHHCSCTSDHVVYPDHRHSVWKTNGRDIEGGTMNIWEENLEARQYVLEMPESHLQTWGLLYCGGRNKFLESLQEESRTFNIPLHEEAFDW